MRSTSAMPGVAILLLPLTVILPIIALSECQAQSWTEYADVPVNSKGDLVFYVDIATFAGEDRNIEEVYCLISNDQIKFIEDKQGYRGKLRFKVELFDQNGDVAGSSENTVDIFAPTSEQALDRSVVQVLQTRITVEPGRYIARAEVEDLNAVKKAIIPYLLKRHKKGEIEVLVESPDFSKVAISVSDIEFARGLRRTGFSEFEKSGIEVIPNAQRRYGLLLPELAVYFEIYARKEPSLDSLMATYSILNRSGGEIFKQQRQLALRGERTPSTALFDITALAAGTYLLVVSVDVPGQGSVSNQRKFDVAWSPLSWGRYDYEMIGDMEHILTEAEMREFKALSPGEKEHYLEEFWRSIDPTPGTAENEARTEYYRRLVYADKHFGTGSKRGALTDRGRIYIKYGPPDDIQSFYSDMEFVKGTRHIEGAETPIPTDPFSRVGIKTGSGEPGGWQQGGSAADIHGDQIGGMTVHGKAYEVWKYDGGGKPVRRLSKRVPTSAVMQFILVDERGIGDYKLVYSTERHEY